MRNSPVARGFTLLELLIVMVIIGITSALAIPMYQDSVRKSRRSDAMASLQSLNVAMERPFFAAGCYSDVMASGVFCPSAPSTWPCQTSSQFYYTLAVTLTGTCPSGALGTGYTLTATANTTTAAGLIDQAKDTSCRAFTLTNTGVKGATDSTGTTTTTCW